MAETPLQTSSERIRLGPRFHFDQLPPLRSNVWITLRTKVAHQLLRGRNVTGKHRIAGLFQFAERLRQIAREVVAGDPFADWWLIKVDQGIDRAETQVREAQQELSNLFEELEALHAEPAPSEDQVQVRLVFAVPAAYRAALALAAFDCFVRDVLTAKHVGLIERRAVSELLFPLQRRMRMLFNLPSAYRKTGITRAKYLAEGAEVERAKSLMGPVPFDVLMRERRSPSAPPLHSDRLSSDGEPATESKKLEAVG